MSSPAAGNAQYSSSSPFQSAQQPAGSYADGEDLDVETGSEYLSDASYSKGPSPQPSTNHFSAEDNFDNPQDSTISPSRPNRFRGPPSTWRNWTAPERDLAASLDQLQAKNLSVHLYNSFKLGQRNRIGDLGSGTRASKTSGKRSTGSQWSPPKVWTAWPLPPGIVPREHEETRWKGEVVPFVQPHPSPGRPGQHLQEMLVAQVLRIAKERFREWQLDGATEPKPTTTSQGEQSQSLGEDFNARANANEQQEALGQKPVVMADDQRASEILQPTVQHIMTKFDGLLMALHQARATYLPVEDSSSEACGQTSERSTSRGRPQKRKRKQSETEEVVEAKHDAPEYPSSSSSDYNPSREKSVSQRRTQHVKSSLHRSRSQKFHDRKGRLGLRDWSDVLGVASMIGWPQNAVRCATARCTTLFEEGIKFRTLQEGKRFQEELLYLPNAPPFCSMEHSQNRIWEGFTNRFEPAMVGAVHVDGFLEPIEGKKSWMYSNSKQSQRRRSSRRSKG